MALGEPGGDLDQLRPVEVEDPPGLRLVAGGDVVTGESADVAHPEQCSSHDVGLDREAVLVAADDLQDRLGAEGLERDGDRDVGRVCVGRGIVGRVDGIDVGEDRLEK